MASISSPSRTQLAFAILLYVILLTSSTAADEDIKVEKHVQMRKAAQDRYMESLLDKAYDMVVWELFKKHTQKLKHDDSHKRSPNKHRHIGAERANGSHRISIFMTLRSVFVFGTTTSRTLSLSSAVTFCLSQLSGSMKRMWVEHVQFGFSFSMSCKKLKSSEVLMPNGQIQNPIVPTDSSSSGKANRKVRLRWTPELHCKFVAAVLELGGATGLISAFQNAKPTAIIQAMERMGVYGLTLNHIKSHLQKYRTGSYQHKDEGREKSENGRICLNCSSFSRLFGLLKKQLNSLQGTFKPLSFAWSSFGQQHEFMNNGTLFPIIFPTHATRGKEICSVASSQTGIRRRVLKKMQVEKHVQMRKEAQDRYMESLLDKAYDMVVWELFKV
ncbi:hypothetical protein OPV22_004045 [Ensete ventricosum]|uniref:Myb-like domain-containing protein n=1 Tax=Ensete ventricosum TaxID=4639 RepID=A0AAV8S2L1_ENSVE|nr:hypothetical protein OPV22_004045 [Ensete ventricosum]